MSVTDQSSQLGFESLIAKAEGASRARRFDRKAEHLPGTIEGAVPYRPFYRRLFATALNGLIERT